MGKATVKKKGRVIKSSKERETGESEEGLKQEWIKFIDEFVANGGNGTRAYMKVYNVSEKVAGASAPRLLGNVSIRAEIDYRYVSQKVTDNGITAELWDIATKYKGAKTIFASVKALEILAKTKGMLVDTKKIAFTGENPALFPSLVKPENAKQFADEVAKGERIAE